MLLAQFYSFLNEWRESASFPRSLTEPRTEPKSQSRSAAPKLLPPSPVKGVVGLLILHKAPGPQLSLKSVTC